ncbi:Serine/threonine-protein kinase PknB [Stieleria maiorica]|uniref:Serine/threonine-protein kinase PknB n=1 Tax=Stieleria maiorica TaxID=2795974 RepID=A0A5B9M653_9BACT|nr:WD40 repeat domain-containing serine/threonine-protein kinase [Stieleria maiorica]QEF96123.1 Serine/threonine-protein kinase PknB [Stieleria maiorica]
MDNPADYQKAKSVFFSVVENLQNDDATALIRRHCNGDARLMSEVERLVAAHQRANRVLDAANATPPDSDTYPLASGDRVGRYEICEMIGEGGMGLVYHAKQIEPLQRDVALKVIKPGLDTREVLARFRVEQQMLAKLKHPNIANVFDAGQTDKGHPFIIMELVDGDTLTEYCDREKSSLKERFNLFLQVCSAVEHAHQRGIIHRDLKPNNILISHQNGKPLPKVIDFGLAKAINVPLSEKRKLTALSRVLGTPQYMSPEQSLAGSDDVDIRSDVYSMGVILHELLTGETPDDDVKQETGSRSHSPTTAVKSAWAKKPSRRYKRLSLERRAEIAANRSQSPLRLAAQLSDDTDWIVVKALEHEKSRRYQTITALSRDLERFLNGDPIDARPPSPIYHFRKLAERYKGAFGILAAVLVSAIAIAAVSFHQAQTERNQRRQIGILLDRVERERLRNNESLYAADIRIAAESLADGDVAQSIALLNRHVPEPANPTRFDQDHRGIEWSHLLQKVTATRTAFSISNEPLNTLAIRPDQDRLVASGDLGLLHDFAFESGQTKPCNMGFGAINTLAFSPDGAFLAVGGNKGMIRLTNPTDFATVAEYSFDGIEVLDLEFSRDGTQLFASGRSPDVRVYDVATGSILGVLRFHAKTIESICISADGKSIACASDDKIISLWNVADRKLIRSSPPAKHRLTNVAFGAGGRTIVYATVKGNVEVRSVPDWELIHAETLPSAVQSLAISADGNRAAVGCRSGVIHLLPADDLTENRNTRVGSPGALKSIYAHRGRVNDVLWLDEEQIASVGGDGALVVSQLDVRNEHQPRDAMPVNRISISDDGRWLATHDYRTVQLVDTHTHQARQVPTINTDSRLAGISFFPGEHRFAVATTDGKLIAAHAEDPDQGEVFTLPETADFSDLIFSADGGRLLLFSRTDDVLVVVERPGLEIVFRASCPDAYTADLTPDGNHLVTSYRGDVMVYHVDSGDLIRTSLRHHSETIADLKFDSNGRHVVTSSDDRTIRIWDPWSDAPGELIGVFPGGVPRTLALSQDDRTLFSVSRSGEAWGFNVPARQKLFPIMKARGEFFDCRLSGDDSVFVTLQEGGLIHWITLSGDFNSATARPRSGPPIKADTVGNGSINE